MKGISIPIRSFFQIASLILIAIYFSGCDSIYGQSDKPKESKVSKKSSLDNQVIGDYAILERMKHYSVPGVSIAVIKNGEIAWVKGYGVLQEGKKDKVDSKTAFSVGSVSKVGAAVSILRLVDQGKLNLDEDVNNYITSWKVPTNSFTKNESVTLRRIMSHTAGLTVHGFADFQPSEDLPTTVQILNGDFPAKNEPVMVNIPIGSRFRYSGGGTQILQLIVEEITKMSFPEATHELVFKPLNMTRSTYANPIPENHLNIAKAHDRSGKPEALPRGYQSMPEMAASGLWTSSEDLAKLIICLMDNYHRNSNEFLSQSLVKEMMTKVPPSNYGLGPALDGNETQKSFSHGGSNDSYKAFFKGYLEDRSGFVILTNGSRGQELIREIREALKKSEF